MIEQGYKGVTIRKPEERDPRDFVRGVSSAITPVVNNASRDWSAYLPAFVPQKYQFDTNNCTGFSFVHTFEIQLNWLKATSKIAPEDLAWFQANGYIDTNGSFALSERFAAIMAGTSINGNSPWNLWKAAAKHGILPRVDFSYSLEQSNAFSSQVEMCANYYHASAVTPAMRTKALQALQRIVIQYEWLGAGEWNTTTPTAAILEALAQAPVQIAVPVCLPGWNGSNVPLCGVNEADHAVTLYAELTDASWDIFDHYQPNPKDLSKGYYIPQAILGVITPRPIGPVVSNPILAPTQVQLTAFERILNWIQAKIDSLRNPTAVSGSASGPPWMWEQLIESLNQPMNPTLKATIISHVELFAVTFVSSFLFAFLTAANSVSVETIFSKAWLSVAVLSALVTGVNAAYNKTFYGNSMGVRQN